MAEKFIPPVPDPATNGTHVPPQMNPLMGVYGNVPGQDPSFLTTQQLAVAIVGLRELLEARMNAMDKAVVILQGVVNRSPTVGEVNEKYNQKFESIAEVIAGVKDTLSVSEKHISQKLAESEANRADALNKAATSIQTGLDKAEKQLQLSLDRIQTEFRGTLLTAEQRLNITFADKDKSFNDTITNLRSLQEEKFSSVEKRTEILFSGIDKQFIERDKRTEQLSLADKTAVAAALQAQKESAASTDESNRIANTKMETNFTKLIEQTQALLQQNTKNTDDKINDIKSRLDKGEGRSAVADPATTETLRAIIEKVNGLSTYKDTTMGHVQGTKDYTALIVAVGGFAVTAIPVMLLLIKTFAH